MANYVIAELEPESSKVEFIEFSPLRSKTSEPTLALISGYQESGYQVLDSLQVAASKQAQDSEAEAVSEEAREEVSTRQEATPLRMNLEAEDAIGFIAAQDVFYHRTKLPFASRQQIEKVLNLHIEDSLPFDTEGFILDHSIVSPPSQAGDSSSETDLVVALSKESAIADSISTFEDLGLRPSIITTKGIGLKYLAELIPEHIEGDSVLLWLGPSSFCCLAWSNKKLVALRELAYRYIEDEAALILEVKSFLMQLEQSELFAASKLTILKPSSLGGKLLAKEERSLIASLQTAFAPLKVSELDLNDTLRAKEIFRLGAKQRKNENLFFPLPEGLETLDFNLHAPALGIIAYKVLSDADVLKDTEILNLRKGPYEFRPFWRNFRKNLKTETFNIYGTLVVFAIFLGVTYFNSLSAVSTVENAISNLVNDSLPGEPITAGDEINYLKQRTAILDSNLRKIGSLSKLSPLQTLKTISEIMPPTLDLQISNLKIKDGLLSFNGTVADTVAFGEMESVLRSIPDIFCSPELSTQGREFRTNRTRFSAKIELCK